ncbi:hypothetical protein E2C01_095019 [Portunus trituberculatus]|uniref:Uncharacterized protein n=1 Tax=Portunus trituberculatus TaxID=210409 RepID=A0A5B7K4N8_PORTR|nr:hypothetical protein [Portunus trituberculatus]
MRQCVKDIGKYSFPHRMMEKWNALSDEVVTAHMCITLKKNWINGDWRQDTISPARTLYNTPR